MRKAAGQIMECAPCRKRSTEHSHVSTGMSAACYMPVTALGAERSRPYESSGMLPVLGDRTDSAILAAPWRCTSGRPSPSNPA